MSKMEQRFFRVEFILKKNPVDLIVKSESASCYVLLTLMQTAPPPAELMTLVNLQPQFSHYKDHLFPLGAMYP